MSDNKFSVAADQYISLDGQLTNIKNKVRLGLEKPRCPYNPEQIAKALQDIIEGKFNHTVENKILRLISADENLLINAVDGKSTIAKAKDVFKSWIDGDFKSWGTNEAQNSTPETPVSVYEVFSDAKLAQMFGSLSGDLDRLCLTQSQIINFCIKYPTWLKQDGSATFFLFKSNEQYFVADVYVRSGGLRVFVLRLGFDYVWNGSRLHRLVTPTTGVA